MPIAVKKKVIDGHEYSCIQFAAFRALGFQKRLFPIMAPVIGTIVDIAGPAMKGKAKSLSDLEIPPGVLALALSKIGEVLASSDAEKLVMELFSGVTRDGKDMSVETNFNDAYVGNMAELYKAVFFVIQANDFFGLSAISTMLGPKMAEALANQSS